jgi:hypothetical protein
LIGLHPLFFSFSGARAAAAVRNRPLLQLVSKYLGSVMQQQPTLLAWRRRLAPLAMSVRARAWHIKTGPRCLKRTDEWFVTESLNLCYHNEPDVCLRSFVWKRRTRRIQLGYMRSPIVKSPQKDPPTAISKQFISTSPQCRIASILVPRITSSLENHLVTRESPRH